MGARSRRFRPRAKSWEMLEFFLETFREALAVVNANAATAIHGRGFRHPVALVLRSR
jgi:hypothetical protein